MANKPRKIMIPIEITGPNESIRLPRTMKNVIGIKFELISSSNIPLSSSPIIVSVGEVTQHSNSFDPIVWCQTNPIPAYNLQIKSKTFYFEKKDLLNISVLTKNTVFGPTTKLVFLVTFFYE